MPGFEWIGLQGLNAEAVSGERVVTGQPIMTLVAVPTDGRHYLAAQTTGLDRNRVYRVTAWVKAAADVKVEVELRDGVISRNGQPLNYGFAVFDPAGRLVASSSGLKRHGIEQGLDDWQKIWLDLATTDGQFVLALGVVSRDRRLFKGDGRSGLTFGGIQIARLFPRYPLIPVTERIMIKAHTVVLGALACLLLLLGSEPSQAQRLRASTDPVIFYAAPDGTDWVNDCRSQQNPCTFVYRESDSAILVMKVTKDRS